ncbi:MAG TPA: hypothetical protein VG939_03015, partial [Caulobacteraceae bacterium]|nr:hypothetical protein [Caulobacteraceae bacterium]
TLAEALKLSLPFMGREDREAVRVGETDLPRHASRLAGVDAAHFPTLRGFASLSLPMKGRD